MKYVLLILAVLGIVVSSLALREHYREYGDSPCSINEHWDCGVVNHSKYALVGGALSPLASVRVIGHLAAFIAESALGNVPVATAGIVGYVIMALLAWFRSYRWLVLFTLGGLGFSLYLATIEKDILGVWCIYCVISLGIITLMTIASVGAAVGGFMRRPRTA